MPNAGADACTSHQAEHLLVCRTYALPTPQVLWGGSILTRQNINQLAAAENVGASSQDQLIRMSVAQQYNEI